MAISSSVYSRIRLYVIAAVLAVSTCALQLVAVTPANALPPAPFDSAFGTNGTAELTIPNAESTTVVTNVIEDSSGRLLGLLEVDGFRVAVVRLLSNGSIDTSFGETGRTQFTQLFQATMAIQGDGKILVGGYVPGNVLPQISITRFTTTGLVDTTFGTNGTRLIGSFPGRLMSSSSKLLLRYDINNDFIYLGFFSPTALPSWNAYNTFTFMSLTQDGGFRFDWGRDGAREVVPWTGSNSTVSRLMNFEILSDGSLLAVGSSFGANSTMQITLIKVTSGGFLDSDFDGSSGTSNGIVKEDFPAQSEVYMSALLPMQDGSFYVAGYAGTLNTGPRHYGMAKFTANGVPDTTFSSDGFVLTQLETPAMPTDVPSLHLLANGNLVFPVDVNNSTGYTTFTPSGDVPTSAHCTTCLWQPSVSTVRSHDLIINSNGNVLIVGGNTTNRQFFATLFTSTGTINNSFQTPDIRFQFPRWSTWALKSIPQSDGSILSLANADNESGISRGAVFKLTSSGIMDQQFGSGGYSLLSPVYEDREFWVADMVVQPDGKILVVGSETDNSYRETLLLWRLNSDGTPDTGFGINGRTVTSDSIASLWSSTIVVQSDGKIMLGVDRRENNFTLPWIYRYLSNGTLDTSFTDSSGFLGGIQPTNNEGEGWGAAVYQGPSGSVYMKSSTTINGDRHSFVMRLTSSGLPDTSFNSTGRRTWDESESNTIDFISDIEIDADGKISLLGGESSPSPERSVVVRLNTDGSLDTSFNSTGYGSFLLRDPNAVSYSNANSIVSIGTTAIVAGGGAVDQFNRISFSAVAKLNSSGSLDQTFGSSGVVLNAPGDNSNFYDIAKLNTSTSLVTGYNTEDGVSTGVVMKVSHQMPPTTTAPTLLAPLNNSQYDVTPTSFTVTGAFPDAVMSGSIHIVLSTTENGGATRSISVTDRQSLNVTFDPLAPHAGILNNSWVSAVTTLITGTSDATSRLPDGTYTVSISYRSAIGGPKVTSSATNVVFRSKCAPGTFSATGFLPCTTAVPGSFQNVYGATASINCPAGTYQPNNGSMSCLLAMPGNYVDASGRGYQTPAPPGRYVAMSGSISAELCAPGTYQPDSGALTCLDAAVNHFVPVQGSPVQIPCPTGTHAPNVRSTSCIALSQSDSTPAPTTPPTTQPPIASPTTTVPSPTVTTDDDIRLVVTVTQSAILKRMKLTVPSGSKVTMRTTSPKVCRVVKTRVQATSTGTCRVTVTLTDKKKKKTTKSTSFRVT